MSPKNIEYRATYIVLPACHPLSPFRYLSLPYSPDPGEHPGTTHPRLYNVTRLCTLELLRSAPADPQVQYRRCASLCSSSGKSKPRESALSRPFDEGRGPHWRSGYHHSTSERARYGPIGLRRFYDGACRENDL